MMYWYLAVFSRIMKPSFAPSLSAPSLGLVTKNPADSHDVRAGFFVVFIIVIVRDVAADLGWVKSKFADCAELLKSQITK